MTPPELISASSGWAKITIALSGISVTISSLLAVASLGMQRFYRTGQGAVACWRAASLSRASRTADRDLLRRVGCRSRPGRAGPGGGGGGRTRSPGAPRGRGEPAPPSAGDRGAARAHVGPGGDRGARRGRDPLNGRRPQGAGRLGPPDPPGALG